jgi:TonB family protein
MKHLYISILLLMTIPLYSQENKANEYRTIIINGNELQTNGIDTIIIVNPMPEFPGGQRKMMEFLNRNLRYPETASKDNIKGKVVLRFSVSAQGEIGNIEVVKSVREDVDNEAIRVIKKMPKWKPGEQHGKPVRVWYTLPISFGAN